MFLGGEVGCTRGVSEWVEVSMGGRVRFLKLYSQGAWVSSHVHRTVYMLELLKCASSFRESSEGRSLLENLRYMFLIKIWA